MINLTDKSMTNLGFTLCIFNIIFICFESFYYYLLNTFSISFYPQPFLLIYTNKYWVLNIGQIFITSFSFLISKVSRIVQFIFIGILLTRDICEKFSLSTF
jgi:hypothetical protein